MLLTKTYYPPPYLDRPQPHRANGHSRPRLGAYSSRIHRVIPEPLSGSAYLRGREPFRALGNPTADRQGIGIKRTDKKGPPCATSPAPKAVQCDLLSPDPRARLRGKAARLVLAWPSQPWPRSRWGRVARMAQCRWSAGAASGVTIEGGPQGEATEASPSAEQPAAEPAGVRPARRHPNNRRHPLGRAGR